MIPAGFTPELRRRTLLLAALYVTSLVAAAVFANLTSYRHAVRWDLSETQHFTLDERTTRALDLIGKKLAPGDRITATVCFDPHASLRPGEEAMVQRIESRVNQVLGLFAERVPQLAVHKLDPFQNRAEMAELVRRFGGVDLSDTVVVESAHHRQFVKRAQLADYDARIRRIERWKVEDALLRALLTAAGERALTYYVTTGTGEPDLASGLTELRALFEPQNTRFVALEPSDAVPDDCDLLVVAAPAGDLEAVQCQHLERYLARGGRALVALPPVQRPRARLATVLARHGVALPGTIALMDRRLELLAPHAGDLHPITRDVPVAQRVRLDVAQTVSRATEASDEVTYVALVSTDADAQRWQHAPDRPGAQRASTTPPPPYELGCATRWPGVVAAGQSPREGRLVVVGSASLLDDQLLQRAGIANRSLTYNAAMWLTDRTEALVGRENVQRKVDLHLDDEQRRMLELALVLVPTVAFCAGILVWLVRKD